MPYTPEGATGVKKMRLRVVLLQQEEVPLMYFSKLILSLRDSADGQQAIGFIHWAVRVYFCCFL
jgi:hypothetical protein